MKTLEQVKERMLALESRQRDRIDVSIELSVLEDIGEFVGNLDIVELRDELRCMAIDFIDVEEYSKARICIWALE